MKRKPQKRRLGANAQRDPPEQFLVRRIPWSAELEYEVISSKTLKTIAGPFDSEIAAREYISENTVIPLQTA